MSEAKRVSQETIVAGPKLQRVLIRSSLESSSPVWGFPTWLRSFLILRSTLIITARGIQITGKPVVGIDSQIRDVRAMTNIDAIFLRLGGLRVGHCIARNRNVAGRSAGNRNTAQETRLIPTHVVGNGIAEDG